MVCICFLFTVECRNRLVVRKKGNLKESGGSIGHKRRVSFDPLALLLDASLEGELELVMRTAEQVSVFDLTLKFTRTLGGQFRQRV